MDSVIYHNCVIADSTNAIYIPHLLDTVKIRIDKFVISKKYGLIYYRFDNGEEFKRIFKHKPTKRLRSRLSPCPPRKTKKFII